MPSPVIPAPAVFRVSTPDPAGRTRTADVPVVRTPPPAECGTVLTVDLAERDGTTLLRAAGEIDLLTVGRLSAALDQALAGPRRPVVVDVRGVTFVDCAGMGLLVDARWRARRRDVPLTIVPSPTVTRAAALLELGATLGLAA